MQAVLMRAFGGPEVLEFGDATEPVPGPGEAVVRVGAVAVSRTRDVATRSGRHPFSRHVTLPHVLGGDFVGVVETTGPGVDLALRGRRVAASCTVTCGICTPCRAGRESQCSDVQMLGVHRWGSYAQLVTVPVANLLEIPEDIPTGRAAAFAANGPIAFTQLEVGEVADGKWVLITGVTGALGSQLAALAHARGARVIGISRRPSAIPAELALEARLDAGAEDLGDRITALTGGAGVAVAIDNVSAPDLFARYFPALAIGGRVVISGAIGVGELPVLSVPAAALYVRSLAILGVRTTTPRDAARFWTLVREGFALAGSPVRVFPLQAAASAHEHVASGEGVGHVVLVPECGREEWGGHEE